MEKNNCCCSPGTPCPSASPPAQTGPFPALSTVLGWKDVLGGWRVRWGIRRNRYTVPPGLYRIGEPDKTAPVLVTANYKLTVDQVRRELTGWNLWLLVLDTHGINVWCAAGKGTFGTEELIRRLQAVGLAQVVEHRRLILPQLGAVGVAAHEVARATGFSVHYGPVLARDLPAYLAAGRKATPEMRRVPFGWKERMVLVPNELKSHLKKALGILLALAALQWFEDGNLNRHLAVDFAPFLAAILAGGVFVPLFLPWLPSRVFAVKGAIAGALCVVAVLAAWPGTAMEMAGAALIAIALASYLGMMFTGSTTFTNQAGTQREVRWALPFILVVAALGSALRIAAAFI